jgi:integrase
MPNTTGGWVDLERRLIWRKADAQTETDKRRPPVGISQRLAAHLRRWRRRRGFVVEFESSGIGNVRNGFRRAVADAGLDGVTPHTLRHTFASWAVQAKVPFADVAEAIGATEAIVRQVYGHLDPEFTRAAVEAVAGKRRRI